MSVNTRRGFSLLELMIVLAIVSIMAALAAIAMSSFQRQGRVAEDMRRTMSHIQQMRQLSSTTGQCYGVFIGGDPTATQMPALINPGVNPAVLASTRMITFHRKAGVACDATLADIDFVSASPSDTILSNDPWGDSGEVTDARRNRVVAGRWVGLMWEMSTGQLINNDFIAMYDGATGLPIYSAGPAGARAALAATGVPLRVRIELRSLDGDTLALSKVGNPTVRELQLGPTGSAVISDCDGNGGPNACP
jgi:prepilin-type N-terminal cleavage/methylation domain-containing protein